MRRSGQSQRLKEVPMIEERKRRAASWWIYFFFLLSTRAWACSYSPLNNGHWLSNRRTYLRAL
ncbi:unnamed protein product [Amoebophrya sp. A120]|nr:unnamed protein product [Amoebophrya sp. A120]|eukprot:GSA120T00018375001.1